MKQIGLVGIGSGAAAALLFATLTSGTYLSVVLFYLAPLPILIAGLGWGHWSALVAAVTGSVLLVALFGGMFSFGFLAAAGAPAWWLSRLALLARPIPAGESPSSDHAVEWFPTGMLVVWCAALGAGLVLLSFPFLGLDEATFHASLVKNISRLVRSESGGTGADDASRMIGIIALVLPPATAVVATVINLMNLWLAARVVKFSSRLPRPWLPLSAMTFPIWLTIVLAAAIALTFAGGIVAIAASVVSAALIVAYGVLGFAVMHEITRGIGSRPFVLAGLYASVLIFGWPLLLLFLLGVTESAFHLRARVTAKRNPPRNT